MTAPSHRVWPRLAQALLGCLLLAAPLSLAQPQAGGQGREGQQLAANLPPHLQQRYLNLTEELACPSCAGSSVRDSPSPVALGLRREVVRLLRQGSTDREIREHLRTLYGDGVSFRPAPGWSTLGLWLLPLATLAAGFGLLLWRRRVAGGQDKNQASGSG